MPLTLTAESIASIPEGALVKRLLADEHWSERIFDRDGIPRNAHRYPEVLLTGLGLGDIDVLAIEPDNLDFATAIQIKRIKVSRSTFGGKAPNGLVALTELIDQTNRLVRLRFAQVFAFSFVVVDSRGANDGQVSYRGLTPAIRSLIEKATNLDRLLPEAGFVQYEFIQPMESPPLHVGAFFSRTLRSPQRAIQDPLVTRWLAQTLPQYDA